MSSETFYLSICSLKPVSCTQLLSGTYASSLQDNTTVNVLRISQKQEGKQKPACLCKYSVVRKQKWFILKSVSHCDWSESNLNSPIPSAMCSSNRSYSSKLKHYLSDRRIFTMRALLLMSFLQLLMAHSILPLIQQWDNTMMLST